MSRSVPQTRPESALGPHTPSPNAVTGGSMESLRLCYPKSRLPGKPFRSPRRQGPQMLSLEICAFAFLMGIVGAIIGGTQAFIAVGFGGIVVFALKAAGVESAFLTDVLMGRVLLPCIIFNAASVAGAYAARKGYDIKGWDVTHSLIFTHDPVVMLVAGVGGLLGYLVYAAALALGIPADAGALSTIVIAVATRALLGQGHWMNHDATAYYKKQGPRYWVFQAINAVAVCGVTALLLVQVDPAYYSIGLYVSALLMLLQTMDRDSLTYPTTHHETLVVGYALAATGNPVAAVLFGMLSNLIYLLFARYFNEGCDTHVDPPSVAILACSLLLNVLF